MELLNLTFDLELDVRWDSNVKFAPLDVVVTEVVREFFTASLECRLVLERLAIRGGRGVRLF
ncbi:hypothetical protein CHELA40_10538 [Chelatococcus asaccharovorans]|nr:hypothetical protein CHELA40_10538 [Chelatococcus asaccharovorans]CAH1686563.1 hypothetical protein CHELA17_65069 [Chelatococcus asaccharovorans]